MPSEIRQVIENSHLFSGLDPGLIEDIAASATKKTLGAHELLFQKGDRADALWGVLSGRIVIEVRADDGKEMVLDEFLVGDVFGEVGVLDFGPRRVEATAACKSELFRLERSHFIEHLQTNPELCFRIFSLLCGHLRDTTETLEDTALYKLPSRLAKRLLLMSHTTASDDGCSELNVVQSDLARMMGVHREAVNRQLRAWEKSGWISIQRQRIKIFEGKSLADFAAPSQSVDPRSWGNDNLSRMLPTAFPTQHEAEATPAQPEKRFAGVLAVSCAEYAVMLKTDSANAIKRIKTGLAAIDKAISDHGGRLIWSAGERSLAEFSDGASAMEAALEIQKTSGLTGPDAEQTDPVFRIGIHSGEVLASGGQFLGEPVNIAIRLTELSGSGGICFTRQVRDELEDTGNLQLQYLGKHELKNVAKPVSVYSARSIPWLKRIVLWVDTLLPRRYRPVLGLLGMLAVVVAVWLGGQRFGESHAPGPPTQSIAVLSFATGGDTTLEYLAQGIPEEVRATLSTIPVVRVIGRESSDYYSERLASTESIARMGKNLNITYVLDGRIHKVGNQLSITAQLIKADDGSQLWSETFDRFLDDVFGIQNEITAAVIDNFKVDLLGTMPSKKATDPEAYALYLKGRYFENLKGRDNSLKAFSAYQQALAIDPEYAPAWVGVSWHYSYYFSDGFMPREEGYVLALEALENALAADNNLALAWTARGHFKMKYDWDWEGARADIDMALQLDPNLPEAIGAAASLAACLGQRTTHLRLREKKVELDPLNLSSLSALGQAYLQHKRPDKALEMFERVVEVNPDYPRIHTKLGRVYLLQGDAERALIEFNKHPTVLRNVLNKASAHIALGNESEAQAIVNEYLATSAQEYPFWTAAIFAWQGDKDIAFEWLEMAFQQQDPELRYILTSIDRRELQSDPRYPVFLEKLGLLEAWKAMPPE